MTSPVRVVVTSVFLFATGFTGILPGAETDGTSQADPAPLRFIARRSQGGMRPMVVTKVGADRGLLYGLSFDGTISYFDCVSNRFLPESRGSFSGRKYEGLAHLDVSTDGRYLATTSVVTRVVALLKTGGPEKRIEAAAEIGPTTRGLADWLPRESIFSPDTRFLYTTDDRGAIHVFRVTLDGNLEWSQSFRELAESTSGTTSLVMHPDGATIFAIDRRDGRLSILDREATSGTIAIRRRIAENESLAAGLGFVADSAISADGRFLYVSAGDCRGDYAVSVFQVLSQGNIRRIQELVDDTRRLRDSCSGNDLALSPDGRSLVVCSKLRDKIVQFRRDPATGRLTRPQIIFQNEEKEPLWVNGPSFASDGTLYVAAEQRGILLAFSTSAPSTVAAVAKPMSSLPANTPAPPGAPTVRQVVPAPPSSQMPPTRTFPPGGASSVANIVAPQAAMPPRFHSSMAPNPPGIAKSFILTGHTARVWRLAFSPDGRRVVSCSDDRTIRVWYVGRRTEQFTLKGIAGTVRSIAWSPDGRIIAAAAGADRAIMFWDADDGTILRRLDLGDSSVACIAFSPDGKQLLSAGDDGTVWLWDVLNGKKLRNFEHGLGSVQCLAFSPDGTLALCGGLAVGAQPKPVPEETLRIWRLNDGKPVYRYQPRNPLGTQNAFFSSDGRSIVAYDPDQHGLAVWDLATGAQSRLFQPRGFLGEGDLASALGGKVAVSTNLRSTDLWLCDLTSGDVRLALQGMTNRARTIAVAPDGRTVAAGGDDAVIYFWELPDAAKLPQPPAVVGIRIADTSQPIVAEDDRLSGHQSYIAKVAFAPDGLRAASCSDDGNLKIWDIPRRAEVFSIQASNRGLYGLAWSPDGKTLAVGGAEGAITFWDSETGRRLRTLQEPSGLVHGLSFAPDGTTLLAAGAINSVSLWSLADGKIIKSPDHDLGVVGGVAFAPDGRTAMAYGGVLSSSADRDSRHTMLQAWNIAEGTTVFSIRSQALTSVRSAAFSSDGKFLAVEDFDAPRSIGIWELATGERTKTVPRGLSTVTTLAFLPGGRHLLIAHIDGVLALHDLSLEQPVRYFEGVSGSVNSLAVSPDGRTILGGGSDRVIRIWRTPETAVPKLER